MSASMAEVLREALRDHRVVWETTHDDEVLLARCKSCGYLSVELETWEHQANVASEILAANGYGKLEDARAQALTDAADDFESNIGVAEFDDLAERNGSRWTHIADAWEYQGPYMDWLRNRAAAERGQG